MAYHGKYEVPDEILQDEELSRDQKIHMLEQWRDDKHAYMRASEEGMEGSVRTNLLRDIKVALASLRK